MPSMRFPDVDGSGSIADALAAPATLDRSHAVRLIEERILGSALRPHDIGRASIEAPGLLYVPFFRVVVTVDISPSHREIFPVAELDSADVAELMIAGSTYSGNYPEFVPVVTVQEFPAIVAKALPAALKLVRG
jgi:hypothetical protein